MFATAIGDALARPLPRGIVLGHAQPFSYDLLKHHAMKLARRPYAPPARPAPDVVQTIDFAAVQKIKFKPAFALWPDSATPVRFFHITKYADTPVRIYALSGSAAREIVYAPHYFDDGGTGIDARLPPDIGFSGFRVMNGPNAESDWLAFQGASYFRTSGAEDQYGISARGIAVDTALATKEEFPLFTTFWLDTLSPRNTIVIYALLESPSITGAYRFQANRNNGVIISVHTELFARADIQRLGVAPLTSMYWYSESNYPARTDWRPAVHDSDGLELWTGKDEHIWRPLIDPPSVQTNSFLDTNPKGFGLLQRDRKFDDYQDDSAFYNRRPSLWVEPVGAWGDGQVQLIEIPTDDEVNDNIVAYWLPRNPVRAGDQLAFDYKLHWKSGDPEADVDLGRVVATRVGRGGIPGLSHPKSQHKFAIDFEGGPLNTLAARFDVTPVVTLSRGKVANAYVIKVVGTNRWRALFDVDLPPGSGVLDMRCFLRFGNKTLTETWLYQYFP